MLPADARVVSVDDHIIEHANVWQDRLAAKWRERGPLVRHEDGIPVWHYDGKRYPPLGLDAVAGDDPYRVQTRLEEVRGDATRLLRPEAPPRRHGHRRDLGVDGVPAVPPIRRTDIPRGRRPRARIGLRAGLERLRARRMVRDRPGAAHPTVDRADVVRRRCVPQRSNAPPPAAPAPSRSRRTPPRSACRRSGRTRGTRCSRRWRRRTPRSASTSARRPDRSFPTLTRHTVDHLADELAHDGDALRPRHVARLRQASPPQGDPRRGRHRVGALHARTPGAGVGEAPPLRGRSTWRKRPQSASATTCGCASSATRPAWRRGTEIGVDKILFEADYPHSDTLWPNSRAGLEQRAAGRARRRSPVDRRRQRAAVAPDPLSRGRSAASWAARCSGSI